MQTLNLVKGQTMNLAKEDGSKIHRVRVGLSWDVAEGTPCDLDLFVVRLKDKGVAYFGDKTYLTGVKLSEDNRTGEGEGDDEFAVIDFGASEDGDYAVCVNIYDAAAKGQSFAAVKSAKATVYNDETDEVLATFQITENGGAHTSLVVGILSDKGDFGDFTAKGDFIDGDIEKTAQSL